MPSTITDIVHYMVEDEFYEEALAMVNSRINFKYFPGSMTLATMMRTVLQVKHDQPVNYF